MRFNTIFKRALAIGLMAVSFLFASNADDERFWYANRALVTIFDDTEPAEDLYKKVILDQQVSDLLKQSTSIVEQFNNANKELNKILGGNQQRYYQKQVQTYSLQQTLNEKNNKIADQIKKNYEEIKDLKYTEGGLIVCLLQQKSVPILISQEILAGVVVASKKLFKEKKAKEDRVAALLKDWYYFEVIDGVYLLIPKQDRILKGWSPSKILLQEAPVTSHELRIGLRLDHLQLLDENILFKKLTGKEILKTQPAKNYERSKMFSERQAKALTGEKGKSPLFVTRVDRKNVSENNYPEQAWVVIMEGHGSTYSRKNQTTNSNELLIKQTRDYYIPLLKANILSFEKNRDNLKNERQRIEERKNQINNFDAVLVSLNSAIEAAENDSNVAKLSLDNLNNTIKQIENLRDQAQAHAGFISGVLAEDMSHVLDFFDKYIQVRFVFWDSCFSGGANAALILKETTKAIQKMYSFDLVAGSNTEAFSFGLCEDADYKAFLGDIFRVSTVQKPVDIMQALSHIHYFYDINDKQQLALNNIPLVKRARSEWVQGSSIKLAKKNKKERAEEQVASFGNILAETCDSKKELNVKLFFGGKESIGGPAVLLLFVENVTCPLLCEEKFPTFISQVTGPAVHIFESIRAPKSSDIDAAKSFLSFESLLENKFFWVKRLELSGKVYEAFFLNTADPNRSERRAFFIEKKNDKIVSASVKLFAGKEVITVPVVLEKLGEIKKFYEAQKNNIESMEKIAQLGLPHAEIGPEKIQKIKSALVTPIPSKVVESQKLLYQKQLIDDFARALARIM